MQVILDQQEWESYLELQRHHAKIVNLKLSKAKEVIWKHNRSERSGNRVIPLRVEKRIFEDIEALKLSEE